MGGPSCTNDFLPLTQRVQWLRASVGWERATEHKSDFGRSQNGGTSVKLKNLARIGLLLFLRWCALLLSGFGC